VTRPALIARTTQLAFLAIVAAAWYWTTETGSVSRLFLPPPRDVWEEFQRLLGNGQFWSAVSVTVSTLVQAYALSVLTGVFAGYAVSRSRFLRDVFEPLIAGLFTIPITLFFPMFILFFGIGTGSKVAYAAVYGFFPIALNTIAAFAAVNARFVKAAQSMGASRWGLFRHVLLPGALPLMFNGLRIGFIISFASVLGGETISSVAGIGRNIALAAELMEPARMYAWITFVVCTSVTLNMIMASIEDQSRTA
jgi:ABC-type nitrate/sulfonate/bicarbonate transport system permease component